MNDRAKAVEYAEWLLRRDGRPCDGACHVHFVDVKLTGYARPIKRARAVTFAKFSLLLPNFDFDPTAPAVEAAQ